MICPREIDRLAGHGLSMNADGSMHCRACGCDYAQAECIAEELRLPSLAEAYRHSAAVAREMERRGGPGTLGMGIFPADRSTKADAVVRRVLAQEAKG